MESAATPRRFAVVFGTRPEAIKLAPVIAELKRRGQEVVVISTAQHTSMLAQAVDSFQITIDHDLGAMPADQPLVELLSRVELGTSELLEKVNPDVVIVQGDTTTTLGAALAAYLLRIPVAHVEAGLRTHDDENPFPEEANRVLVARLARWHFAPTETARQNLLREGIDAARIHVTGNTVLDAAMMTSHEGAARDAAGPAGVTPALLSNFILVTTHRRESHGQPLEDICRAIRTLVDRHNDLSVIWPVHRNPRVREAVQRCLEGCSPRLQAIDPVSYELMLQLLRACRFVLTDSGGVQEEAALFQKPVLIMRKATDRPEIIECGAGRLVGTDPDAILATAEKLLTDDTVYRRMSTTPNPFGDGRAAERITDVLLDRAADRSESSATAARKIPPCSL